MIIEYFAPIGAAGHVNVVQLTLTHCPNVTEIDVQVDPFRTSHVLVPPSPNVVCNPDSDAKGASAHHAT
jgi:hypothetical protein